MFFIKSMELVQYKRVTTFLMYMYIIKKTLVLCFVSYFNQFISFLANKITKGCNNIVLIFFLI